MPGRDEGICMPTDVPAWSLHSRLKEDTIDIGDLPLCRVLVIKDAHYPWLLLVPRRNEAVEIIDLDEVEQPRRAASGRGREAAAAARRRGSSEFHQRASPQDMAWLGMTAFDSFPL